MIYSMATYHEHGPVRVFDANGYEIPYCRMCNTETGEVVELLRDEGGRFVIEGDVIREEAMVYLAPLRVVPVEV